MIHNLVQNHRPKISKDVIFTHHCPTELDQKLYFEHDPIFQSVSALLTQSVHNTKKGRIHIHVTNQKLERGQNKITIIIADTGAGFSPIALEALKNSTNGVFEKAHKHAKFQGGDLKVRSRQGKGTEVNLSFIAYENNIPQDESRSVSNLNISNRPMVNLLQRSTKKKLNTPTDHLASSINDTSQIKEGVLTPDMTAESPEWVTKISTTYADIMGQNILIVEDNESNRHAIKSLLEPLKAEIVVTENGIEAINALKNKFFDIIIMDIHMPKLNGIETTTLIRENELSEFRIPIIALTADNQNSTKQAALQSGIDHILTKPVTIKELFDKFLELHQAKQNRLNNADSDLITNKSA